jgi:hypothetical protein
VVRDLGVETKGTIYNKIIQILTYEDNIISGETHRCDERTIINLSEAAKEMGLKSLCKELDIWK